MPSFALRVTTMLVLVSASLLAACQRQEGTIRTSGQHGEASQRPASGSAGERGPGVSATGGTDTDLAITADVKTRLALDSQLGALDLTIETKQGRVVLRGVTPDTAARSHAAELARAASGVLGVANNLSVQVTKR